MTQQQRQQCPPRFQDLLCVISGLEAQPAARGKFSRQRHDRYKQFYAVKSFEVVKQHMSEMS